MNLPPADFALARHIDAVTDRFMLGWLEGTDAVLSRFGRVVAPVTAGSPDVDFLNRPLFFDADAVDEVDSILEHYRAHGVRPWFEISPHPHFEELAGRLAAGGAAQVGYYSAMYGPTGPPDHDVSDGVGVVIRRAEAGDAAVFAGVYFESHDIPAEARDSVVATMRQWFDHSDWRLYLATVDGTPAGVAALTVDGPVAYLASASTLPTARRRGVQKALLRRRIGDAFEAGAPTIVSVCAFASGSQRNLERAGLRLAHLRFVWRAG